MEIKTSIYTSCYSKMLKRHKIEGMDYYIKVSRSLFYPKIGTDGVSIMQQIDYDFGNDLGMYSSSLEEYEKEIKKDEYIDSLNKLVHILKGLDFKDLLTDEDYIDFQEEIKERLEWKERLLKLPEEKQKKEYDKLTEEEKDDLLLLGLSSIENLKTWKPVIHFNFFILCFEDLNTTYTKKDELKYNGQVKAGELKKCHRTILANLLNERFNLNIKEW